MTGSLRSTARNPVAIALMGVLILVFLILGVGGGGRFPDIFRGAKPDAVVAAGAHAVDSRDFRRIFEQQKERIETQAKQTFTAEFLVRNGFDQQLLNEIALDQAFAEMLSRSGIQPAAALVDSEIRKLPFAFDRVTGKFSERQFTQFLAQQGLTPKQAQAEITDELAQRHFTYAMEAGFKLPVLYAALNAAIGLEMRDVSYFVLGPSAVPPPAPPTDAQLLAFMKEHASQITRPEMRVITLARISAKDFEPTVTVDDAAVAEEFATRKQSLSTPERRTIVQIPLKTPAQAETARAGLAKGEDANALAGALGVQAIAYTNQPQAEIADRKIAAVAFAMQPGEIRGPVQGDLGTAVLKVVKVAPGAEATLASARPKIEADLRAKLAADKAYEISQKFDDARQAGASVAVAAEKSGVTAVTLGPVTAQGQDLQGKPNPLVSDKVLKSAFSLAVGEDTDLEDAGPGDYYAVRVERVIAPSLPPLAEVRAEITRAYMGQKLLEALRGKADALAEQVRKGAPIEQAAAGVGAHVVHQEGMQRISLEKLKGLGRDFLQGAFTAKAGEVFSAPGPGGVFVARLEAVRPGDVTAMAQLALSLRPRLAEDYLRDFIGSAKSAARAGQRVTINLDLARRSAGVDPALLAKPKSARGAAAK